MLILALILFMSALLLLWYSGRQRKVLGLPAGRIISTDTRKWAPVEQALYDAETGLTGRPDYLFEQSGKLIPVEVKSQRVGAGPYDAHLYQLAAYCLLVHRSYGKRPDYGILHYPNRTYAVGYTPKLEAELLSLIEETRLLGRRKEPKRSHESIQRCQSCGFRSICDQRLL